MTFSLDKLKTFLPSAALFDDSKESGNAEGEDENASIFTKIEPEVGFKLLLEGGKGVGKKEKDRPAELHVHLIGARHLPGTLGLRSIKGYMVKVKLFPGIAKFDSDIQTSSWPKFDQIFKFDVVEPCHRRSIKEKKGRNSSGSTLPEKLFKGNFIVFTIFGLLELPPEVSTSFRDTYSNLKRQGSMLLRQKSTQFKLDLVEDRSDSQTERLIRSERGERARSAPCNSSGDSNRNIGSVTWVLDPKLFNENPKTGNWITDELWLPIKEFSNQTMGESRVHSSLKGQIEMMLELSEIELEVASDISSTRSRSSNVVDEEDTNAVKADAEFQRNRLRKSFRGVKNIVKPKKKEKIKTWCLKITTTRMRCPSKAKEGFEKISPTIYVKLTVYQSDTSLNKATIGGRILKSWTSDPFAPTLSTKWEVEDSTIVVPFQSEADLENINIRVSLNTKTTTGKKINFGQVNISSVADGTQLDHWTTMQSSKGKPVTMWHNFQ